MLRSQEAISKSNATDALMDCTIMLYVMTERWPRARKYRTALEQVKQSVLDRIANGKPQQASSGGIVDAETRQASEGLDRDFVDIGLSTLPQMIDDIAGAPALMWIDDDFDVELFNDLQAFEAPPVPSFDTVTSMEMFSGEDASRYKNIVDDDWSFMEQNQMGFL